MTNQLITDLKIKYNTLKYKVKKAVKVMQRPMPNYILVEHRNAAGELLYHNAAALINQGEEAMLKGWVQAVANYRPSGFKVNLATDATIAETATTYTAVTGTGYAEVTVATDETDWTASMPADTWQVLSKNCVFTATASDWTLAKKVVLEAVLNSVDTIVAYADLVGDRQLYDGDTLTVSLILTLE